MADLKTTLQTLTEGYTAEDDGSLTGDPYVTLTQNDGEIATGINTSSGSKFESVCVSNGDVYLAGTNYSDINTSEIVTYKEFVKKADSTTVIETTDVSLYEDNYLKSTASRCVKSAVESESWLTTILKCLGITKDDDTVGDTKYNTWKKLLLPSDTTKVWQDVTIVPARGVAESTVPLSTMTLAKNSLFDSGIISQSGGTVTHEKGNYKTIGSLLGSSLIENGLTNEDDIRQIGEYLGLFTFSYSPALSEDDIVSAIMDKINSGYVLIYMSQNQYDFIPNTTSSDVKYGAYRYDSDNKVWVECDFASSSATGLPVYLYNPQYSNNGRLSDAYIRFSENVTLDYMSISSGTISWNSNASDTGQYLMMQHQSSIGAQQPGGEGARTSFQLVSPEFDTETRVLTGKFHDLNGNEVDVTSTNPQYVALCYQTTYDGSYAFPTSSAVYSLGLGHVNIFSTSNSWTAIMLNSQTETDASGKTFDEFVEYVKNGGPYTADDYYNNNMVYAGVNYNLWCLGSIYILDGTLVEGTTGTGEYTLSDGFTQIEDSILPTKDDTITTLYPDWVSSGTARQRIGVSGGMVLVSDDTDLPLGIMSTTGTQTGGQTGTPIYSPITGVLNTNTDIYDPSNTDVSVTVGDATGTTSEDNSDNTSVLPGGNVPIIMPTGTMDAGMWTAYNPTESEIKSFSEWLWTTDLLENIKKIFVNDPMEAIISIHRVYASVPTGSSTTIKCGNVESTVSAKKVSNRYVETYLGSVTVPHIYNNFIDYGGVDLTIMLPFIGARAIDPSIVMGGGIGLTYRIDLFTGACVAALTVAKNNVSGVVYQWSGNMFEQVPITASDMSSVITGTAIAAAGAVATVATGGAAAPALASLGGLASVHTSIQSCGNISGSAGALASKTPYIVMTVQQPYNSYNWRANRGLPENKTVVLGSVSGYIEVDGISNTSAFGGMSDTEFNEMRDLLRGGVYM